MNWRYIFIIVGYMQAAGMTITLLYVFINAYLHDFKTTVLINAYGEAHVELIFLIVISVFIFGGLFFVLRDLEYEKD